MGGQCRRQLSNHDSRLLNALYKSAAVVQIKQRLVDVWILGNKGPQEQGHSEPTIICIIIMVINKWKWLMCGFNFHANALSLG